MRDSMKYWVAGFFLLTLSATRASGESGGGVVSHVSVTSNHTDDVSSLEAWKKSFIKPGMTDHQKAIAIWESVVRYRHQENPPNEFLESEGHPHDPIKDFNVYGYGQCCCASANIEALARYIGLPARGWAMVGHSVPEVQYDNGWHMLDASLIGYFPKANGSLAGVEEITASLAKWFEGHPNLKGDNDKLYAFMRDGGWRKGPELLASCPTYDGNGWLPAGTHGWYSSMQEFGDRKNSFVFEYGTALGYEVNVQLRRGERLTRNWSNKGLHVNALEGASVSVMNGVVGKDQLAYAPAYGDLAPGRIGNGLLEYDVPLADGSFFDSALTAENLSADKDAKAAAVHVKDAAKPGVLEIRMPSSYVYLSGEVDAKMVIPPGGEVAVALSDNNGLDWKDVAKVTTNGEQKFDLKALVYRRYDYRIRFTMRGAGTGLDALKFRHDVQHSQRALPALAEGKNTITFAVGAQEGTITVQGNINPEAKGKNLLLADFHPEMKGLEKSSIQVGGTGSGELTIPVATPGDIKRLRIGAHYRARDAKDGWDLAASFDGGKTWKAMGRLAGPTGSGNSVYLVLSDVPAGARSALVRFAGQQRNTTCLFDLRISADYAEPHGGFAPIKVTYVWEEAGKEKRDVHTASKANETYVIQCAGKPVLKSLIVEQAH